MRPGEAKRRGRGLRQALALREASRIPQSTLGGRAVPAHAAARVASRLIIRKVRFVQDNFAPHSLGPGGLRPGEVSLAHHGVLFLDELPEFDRRALEGLREPLESARVHLARAAQRAEFPARFLLVAAMNPCPCGQLGNPARECQCSAAQVTRYRARLSGPLLDRIDLRVEVAALPPDALLELPPGEPSATVAQRVRQAALVQQARQGMPNAALAAADIERHCCLPQGVRGWLGTTLARLGSSARATHRVLRVARSIADLAGADAVAREHLAEAMQLRRALGAA